MFDKKAYLKQYLLKYNPIYYQNHRDELSAAASKRTIQRTKEHKLRAVQMLGGKCERCGYNKCIKALEFHHPDPTNKGIWDSNIWRRKWSIIEQEIAKCILLCANCHREVES